MLYIPNERKNNLEFALKLVKKTMKKDSECNSMQCESKIKSQNIQLPADLLLHETKYRCLFQTPGHLDRMKNQIPDKKFNGIFV